MCTWTLCCIQRSAFSVLASSESGCHCSCSGVSVDCSTYCTYILWYILCTVNFEIGCMHVEYCFLGATWSSLSIIAVLFSIQAIGCRLLKDSLLNCVALDIQELSANLKSITAWPAVAYMYQTYSHLAFADTNLKPCSCMDVCLVDMCGVHRCIPPIATV